ncbi:MAG: glycoside hydrolase family 3 N-terminal domain-containing protein [Cyclobacteriaceae bacterium]
MKRLERNGPKAKWSSRFLIFSTLIIFSQGLFAQQLEGSIEVMPDSLSIKVGQMVMIGLGEFQLPEEAEAILPEIKAGKVGGVVIYEKNIDTITPFSSLQSIMRRTQSASPIPLFTSIDEEGGRVTRLKSKYGFPTTKQAGELGQMDNLDSTYFYAAQTASLLDSLGINLNYAPDIDVDVNPNNPVIGKLGRTYGADPAKVAAHGMAVVDAHRDNNVGTVLKHFPGHGSSSTDSHLDMTDVTDSWMFYELAPYKTMLDSGRVDGIMTAHIINQHLDSAMLPATLSKSIITGILRDFMGFEGVVFSDDMQMHAISKQYGLKNAIKMAIDAGVDVLMFANNVPKTDKRSADEIHGMIMQLVRDGEITEERVDASYQRVMKMKTDLGVVKEKKGAAESN